VNKIVYRGTLAECVKHFASLVTEKYDSAGGTIARQMNTFLGMQGAYHDWFVCGTVPRGTNLVKLELLLFLLGYEVSDRMSMSERGERFIRFVCSTKLNMEDIGSALGVTGNSVLRWARGEISPSSERVERLNELINREWLGEFDNLWERFASELLNLLLIQESGPPGQDNSPVIESSTEGVQSGGIKEAILVSIADSIKAMIPLAKIVLSDGFSPENRRKLRLLTATGQSNGVFDLANLLNGLCGERARSVVTNHSSQKSKETV
jgi:transcriptional regulator with XRE-family HTH domain